MIYKIKLKPLNPYFFGIEEVAELGNKRNFYLKSSIFPQQTSILGMLRYQILAQNGKLYPYGEREDMKRLIGCQSFAMNYSKGYGAIKKISPVQLCNGDNIYFLRNKEYIDLNGSYHQTFIETSDKFIFQSESNREKITLLKYQLNEKPENWSEKKYFAELFQSIKSPQDQFCMGELFTESGRVGIEKLWTGDTKSAAYYKQFFKVLSEYDSIARKKKDKLEAIEMTPLLYAKRKLKSDWCFYFEIEIDESIFSFDIESRFVSLGGEQSQFLMTIETNEEKTLIFDIQNIPDKEDTEIYKLILISDTYIESEKKFYDTSIFVNAETVRFKNFISKVDTTENYTIKGANRKGFVQSVATHLLKRGSVFYFEDDKNLEEAIKLIKSAKQFRTIGYNYFTIEKLKINK